MHVASTEAKKNDEERKKAEEKAKIEKKINPFDGLIHNPDGTPEFVPNEFHPDIVDEVNPDGGGVTGVNKFSY